MSSTDEDPFMYSSLVPMPFISLYEFITLAKTSSTVLKRSDESGHPCLVPD